jgi:hypothetical protein
MEGEGDLAAPRRAHLEAAARAGDPEAICELEHQPQLPPLAAHLWLAFIDLSRSRRTGMAGPEPISRADIRLWEEDECTTLQPWERRALLALDAAWLKSLNP